MELLDLAEKLREKLFGKVEELALLEQMIKKIVLVENEAQL